MKLSHTGPAVVFELAAVAVAATRQSFVGRLNINWSVLTVNIIYLSCLYGAVAAILNG